MKTSCGRKPGCCTSNSTMRAKIDVARVGDGELDQHQVIGALDIQVRLAIEEFVLVVLGDDHKAVFVRYDECLAHGAIDSVTDRFLVSG